MSKRTYLPIALPCTALVLNALVWGLSWWPLRTLHQAGLHPLWASSLTYLLGCLVTLGLYPGVLRQFAQDKALWVLALAAGLTMLGFNWGVAIGDVVRVVLLFYLMPIWAVVLARLVLGEPIRAAALLPVGLAIFGATLVLSPPGQLGFPWPSGMGEFLGLGGGMAFALNNIMLRHQKSQTGTVRLFGMFVGGAVVPALAGLVFMLPWLGLGDALATPAWPGALGSTWALLLLLGFAVSLLLANFGLQYGAARLPAGLTAVVMLSEVVFATGSAVLLGGQILSVQVLTGGLLIMLAAALSTRLHSSPAAA